ncbi:ferredoxin Fer [Haloquadratum walsbyi]
MTKALVYEGKRNQKEETNQPDHRAMVVSSVYDILGISPSADEETILQAYRTRIKEVHPDHGGSLTEFKRVRRAYEHIDSGAPASEFNIATEADYTTTTQSGDTEPTSTSASSSSSVDEADETDTLGPTVEYLDYEILADYGWKLTDPDLFAKADAVDLDIDTHGIFVVEPRESLLEAAERYGFSWPYACRGGACANCAIAVIDGVVEMSVSTILTDGMVNRGIRLSCIGQPVSNDLQVVFNIEQLPGLKELRLPAEQFGNTHSNDLS